MTLVVWLVGSHYHILCPARCLFNPTAGLSLTSLDVAKICVECSVLLVNLFSEGVCSLTKKLSGDTFIFRLHHFVCTHR